MLVLSRLKGQQVVIGGNLTVTVLEVRGDKVKLGFTGPAEVPIHRKEVYDRLLNERQEQADAQRERERRDQCDLREVREAESGGRPELLFMAGL